MTSSLMSDLACCRVEGGAHHKPLYWNTSLMLATIEPFDLNDFALLLDVDGTILDLAPTRRGVHVPDELRPTLTRIMERNGGALALVSGRPIADLDAIFAPLQLPAIGGHGAEMRLSTEPDDYEQHVSSLDPSLKQHLMAIVARHP